MRSGFVYFGASDSGAQGRNTESPGGFGFFGDYATLSPAISRGLPLCPYMSGRGAESLSSNTVFTVNMRTLEEFRLLLASPIFHWHPMCPYMSVFGVRLR